MKNPTLRMAQRSEKTRRILKTLNRGSSGSSGPGKSAKTEASGQSTPAIELFQNETDISCHAVRQRLSEMGLDFVAHTVTPSEPITHKRMFDEGGRDEIPFLIDHSTGVKLYKSETIIAYLENQYEKGPQSGIPGWISRLSGQVTRTADRASWLVQNRRDALRSFRRDIRIAVVTFGKSVNLSASKFKGSIKKAA